MVTTFKRESNMANIETDAAGRPIAYDSAGNPIVVTTAPTYTDRTVVRERSGGGMGWLLVLVIIVALVVAAFAFKLVNIDQLTSGSAPKVAVEGGSLPTFKVDTAKVNVGTKQEDITTPTVSVGTKTTGIDVPTVSVEKADAAKK
jgi:hypothetical protein